MAFNNELIWRKVLEVMREMLNPESFKAWFENSNTLPSEENTIPICVKDIFTADWLEQHYLALIEEAVLRVTGKEMNILFAVPQNGGEYLFVRPTSDRGSPEKRDESHNHPLLNPRYTFDRFVVGDFNRFAYAASMAVAETPGTNKYNPLYIYGGVGLGKTHLLQAIGQFVHRQYSGRKVMYVTSERFTDDYIAALMNKRIPEFDRVYRNVDVLLVDDVQFLSGKEGTQKEFFHIFNALHQQGKQIVITSDIPPSAIVGFSERLASRLNWGLVVDIQPPDMEGRMAILRKKLFFDGSSLPDDVLYFIASNVTSNIRVLEGILTRLLVAASISGQDIDINVARNVISHYYTPSSKPPLDIDIILLTVSKAFGVTVEEILSRKRTQTIARARQVVMFLSRKLTNLSLNIIGKRVGGRNHATVIYAVQQIDALCAEDISFNQQVQRLISELTPR